MPKVNKSGPSVVVHDIEPEPEMPTGVGNLEPEPVDVPEAATQDSEAS